MEAADLKERRGKENNDEMQEMKGKKRCVWVNGPVIVGAGPSGLATAACLREQGVPSYVILERSGCLASLWKERTYDRLRLHLPKCFCELPLMPFPNSFPTYPTKQQFLQYVDEYARRFDIRPRFNECVLSASFDQLCGLWRVLTSNSDGTVTRYICRWLVVATGENSQPVLPQIPGLPAFTGQVLHSSSYRSGAQYNGKKVLVVGSGNSGMELSLDLFHHRALPSIVVRSPVHVLPKEMFGKSTFGVAMRLMRLFPVWIVDKILLIMSALILGNTESFGLHRPSDGPIQIKNQSGKTPVMDIGTLSHIKKGNIKVVPGVKRFRTRGAMFVDGREMEFDSVILATGYKNNVPLWLKDWYAFFTEEGVPRKEYGKGKRGLYAVGFTRKGLLGVSADARFVARDIASQMTNTRTLSPCVSLSVTSSPLHLPTGTECSFGNVVCLQKLKLPVTAMTRIFDMEKVPGDNDAVKLM